MTKGYLFFGDALGMATLMHSDWKRADAALNSIGRVATTSLKATLPGGLGRPGAAPGARLVVFNDSVFFFAHDPAAVVHFASTLALSLMLTTEEKGGPIALRGGIAQSASPPAVRERTEGAPCPVTAVRFVADRVSAALVAEKGRVLGPRILIEREIIDEGLPHWPFRLAAKLMAINTIPKNLQVDTLRVDGDASSYVDLGWMVVEDAQTLARLSEAIDVLNRSSAFSSRAAIHTAATRALWKLANARRNGLSRLLQRKHFAGQQKSGVRPKTLECDYREWLNLVPQIEAALGMKIVFPIEMSGFTEFPK